MVRISAFSQWLLSTSVMLVSLFSSVSVLLPSSVASKATWFLADRLTTTDVTDTMDQFRHVANKICSTVVYDSFTDQAVPLLIL